MSVCPNIELKKPPGDLRQMANGKAIKTDASGRWHFDSVPASMDQVFVEINHPNFGPMRRTLKRA